MLYKKRWEGIVMMRWFHVDSWHVDWWMVTDWRFWILFAPQYHATMLVIAALVFVGEIALIRGQRRIEHLLQRSLKQRQKKIRHAAVSFVPMLRNPRRSFS